MQKQGALKLGKVRTGKELQQDLVLQLVHGRGLPVFIPRMDHQRQCAGRLAAVAWGSILRLRSAQHSPDLTMTPARAVFNKHGFMQNAKQSMRGQTLKTWTLDDK